MKLSLNEAITVQLALNSTISNIKKLIAPDKYKFTSIRELEELKKKVDLSIVQLNDWG